MDYDLLPDGLFSISRQLQKLPNCLIIKTGVAICYASTRLHVYLKTIWLSTLVTLVGVDNKFNLKLEKINLRSITSEHSGNAFGRDAKLWTK